MYAARRYYDDAVETETKERKLFKTEPKMFINTSSQKVSIVLE
jgi:hypothetical protein